MCVRGVRRGTHKWLLVAPRSVPPLTAAFALEAAVLAAAVPKLCVAVGSHGAALARAREHGARPPLPVECSSGAVARVAT
jgi:hypothetical protein